MTTNSRKTSSGHATRQQNSNSLSRTKKTCFGLVTTVLGLVAIELALTLIGVGKSTDQADPMMGFSKQVPLLERHVDEDGKVWMRTAENKLIWFNDQRFPLTKPANTQRIFCLGGSTTFGRPYDDNTSFAGWLREWLPRVDADTDHEVFNAGGVSYASYRVAAVMEELAEYEPDLFIVYTGQNEFLERRTYADFFDQSQAQLWLTGWLNKTRTYRVIDSLVPEKRPPKSDSNSIGLAAEVDERLNHTVGPSDYVRDEEWSDNVRKHFRFNVRRMISIAQSANAKILFVVPASNEKDCGPFKPDPEEDFFEQGRQAFEAGDYEVARSAFQSAIDRDICPLRAPSDFAQFIRELPESDDVRVLDFESALRDVCQNKYGHDILGEEYFLDHVHPTIEAHRQLSRWLIAEMQDAGWLADGSIALEQLPPEAIAEVDQSVFDRIDRRAQGIAMRNLAKVMHWAGKFEVAAPRARDAIRILDGDAESQFILADCLRWMGRVDESVEEFERGVKAFPDYYRGLQRYGQLLLELEDYEAARDLLVVATVGIPESDPRHWLSRFQLAIAHLGASDFESAHEELLRCNEHAPDDLDVVFALAEASAGIGDSEAAIRLYERILDDFPDDVPTHLNLAHVFLSQDQIQQASLHFETALLLAPDNSRARAGMMVIDQLNQSAEQNRPCRSSQRDGIFNRRCPMEPGGEIAGSERGNAEADDLYFRKLRALSLLWPRHETSFANPSSRRTHLISTLELTMQRPLFLFILTLVIPYGTVSAFDPTGNRDVVRNTPGLVAFWDFTQRESTGQERFIAHVSAGSTNVYPLDAANYVRDYWGEGRQATYADFPLLNDGPFGQAIRIRQESDPNFRPFLFIPRSRLHDTPLDIKGEGKSVTVVVWAIRESGNHALAGIWHEGTDLKQSSTASIKKVERGQRQYALFAGLNKAGSACGHVSENGASSFLNKYALHKCNSLGQSPAVSADSPPEKLAASWQCFAMTFDDEKNEITGWLNGESGERWLKNPKSNNLLSYAHNAYMQAHYARTPGMQDGEDSEFPEAQYYSPPEGEVSETEVLREDENHRVERRRYRYTEVVVTLEKDENGEWVEADRNLVGLRLNPWWYPHGIYSPPDAEQGGPFTIGRVIHSSRSVGFTGWIGGVSVFDRALSEAELKTLADLRN